MGQTHSLIEIVYLAPIPLSFFIYSCNLFLQDSGFIHNKSSTLSIGY